MIDFQPSPGPIGAQVQGISLAEPPTSAAIDAIETALERYGVLVFRDQQITPAQQIAFSAAFADLEPTARVEARLEGHPEIFVVGNTGKRIVSFAPADGSGDLEWHSDHMHLDQPARASLLYCREAPPVGGDTLFACMYSAFDSLGLDEQAVALGLTAIHSIAGLQAFLREKGERGAVDGEYAVPEAKVVKWPLVRHHPLTGRPALYFGSKVTIGIEGWDVERARDYLSDLNTRATATEFQYGHEWRPGDAVLWDNRRVLHAGTPFDSAQYRREMHRTTFREDQPIQ